MTKLRTHGLFATRSPKESNVRKIRSSQMACAIFAFCALTAIVSPAQTFKTLADFEGTNGLGPYLMSFVQGTDGNLYGTTYEGGTYNLGTAFKVTTGGKLSALHSFCAEGFPSCPDGLEPYAGLVQGTDGNFYGTTYEGGANRDGTVFKITAGGTLTTLHGFAGYPHDSGYPEGALVQAANGDFYGTTVGGGTYNEGTVFKITAGGTLTTLYSFCTQTNCTDGEFPIGGLVQASNGDFYGTTNLGGGTSDTGTVFKITAGGTLTTLYSFCAQTKCADGANPWAGLVQATDGNFYGTTSSGGSSNAGTIFKITPAGKLTTLYSFCSQTYCPDGAYTYVGLVQATDGNFYGTTFQGGTYGYGTVFKITSGGTLTTLHSFCSQSGCPDGFQPFGGLFQATNGTLYGTTYSGGDPNCNGGAGCGTVFSLSVGLGPFVETNPTSGKVGTPVIILGTNLTGATSVTFNGTAAKFSVVSKSEITTTVPEGATTGTVEVTTPKGTLKSNVVFRVTK